MASEPDEELDADSDPEPEPEPEPLLELEPEAGSELGLPSFLDFCLSPLSELLVLPVWPSLCELFLDSVE